MTHLYNYLYSNNFYRSIIGLVSENNSLNELENESVLWSIDEKRWWLHVCDGYMLCMLVGALFWLEHMCVYAHSAMEKFSR